MLLPFLYLTKFNREDGIRAKDSGRRAFGGRKAQEEGRKTQAMDLDEGV